MHDPWKKTRCSRRKLSIISADVKLISRDTARQRRIARGIEASGQREEAAQGVRHRSTERREDVWKGGEKGQGDGGVLIEACDLRLAWRAKAQQ